MTGRDRYSWVNNDFACQLLLAADLMGPGRLRFCSGHPYFWLFLRSTLSAMSILSCSLW